MKFFFALKKYLGHSGTPYSFHHHLDEDLVDTRNKIKINVLLSEVNKYIFKIKNDLHLFFYQLAVLQKADWEEDSGLEGAFLQGLTAVNETNP